MTTWSLLRMRRCTQAQILHSEAFRVIFGGQAVCQRFWGTPKMLTFQWQVEWRKCAWYGSIGVTLLGCHHSGGSVMGVMGPLLFSWILLRRKFRAWTWDGGGNSCKTLSLYNLRLHGGKCWVLSERNIPSFGQFRKCFGQMTSYHNNQINNRYPGRSWTVCPWKVTFPIGKDHLPTTIFQGEHVKFGRVWWLKRHPCLRLFLSRCEKIHLVWKWRMESSLLSYNVFNEKQGFVDVAGCKCGFHVPICHAPHHIR